MAMTLLILPLSYLLGCFTTGYYLVRLQTGQDIRDVSSGNVGSRNVGRLLGTIYFDGLKSVKPEAVRILQ